VFARDSERARRNSDYVAHWQGVVHVVPIPTSEVFRESQYKVAITIVGKFGMH
jgi:hypothetical protein